MQTNTQLPSTLRIHPAFLDGTVRIPPSKSLAHRAVMAASLARGTSRIENIAFSVDIGVTVDAMEALGAVIHREKGPDGRYTLTIQGNGGRPQTGEVTLDCAESGSTLRFLIPLGMQLADRVTLTGAGRLVERPLDVYYRLFEERHIAYQNDNGKLPLTVGGRWTAGTYRMRGDVSSQFVTGLLYTLPLLAGDSRIEITTEMESRGYLDLTLDMLRTFGIRVNNHEDYRVFDIPGGQSFQARDYRVEGDYSQAAFYLVAGALNGNLVLEDLHRESLQGDKIILQLFAKMGADLQISPSGSCHIRKGKTRGIEVDCQEFPDLVPVLAVLAALSEGTSRLTGLERLKIKESDRLLAIATELETLGAVVRRGETWLELDGVDCFQGGTVDAWNDHRIAMSMAVAALASREPVILTGAGSVRKSYPEFWSDYRALGGMTDEWNLGK